MGRRKPPTMTSVSDVCPFDCRSQPCSFSSSFLKTRTHFTVHVHTNCCKELSRAHSLPCDPQKAFQRSVHCRFQRLTKAFILFLGLISTSVLLVCTTVPPLSSSTFYGLIMIDWNAFLHEMQIFARSCRCAGLQSS